jgi:hypothetical protein
VGIVYPMLMRMNYTEWSLVMRVKLQAAGLWEAMHYGNVEYRDNRHALAGLLHAVPAEMQADSPIKSWPRMLGKQSTRSALERTE